MEVLRAPVRLEVFAHGFDDLYASASDNTWFLGIIRRGKWFQIKRNQYF